MFGPEQIPDVLEVLSWYDDVQAEDVHNAVLTLSKGDVDRLLDLVVAAVTDFRDVLLWASLPEPTPEELAAEWARIQEMVREAQDRRHQYLVAKFGAKGAEQVERSNRNLFGKPPRQGHGTSSGDGRLPSG